MQGVLLIRGQYCKNTMQPGDSKNSGKLQFVRQEKFVSTISWNHAETILPNFGKWCMVDDVMMFMNWLVFWFKIIHATIDDFDPRGKMYTSAIKKLCDKPVFGRLNVSWENKHKQVK